VERLRAEMAGTITGRHPHRTRAFRVLFSDRHLHHSQHRVELAFVDFSTLTISNGRPIKHSNPTR
jgi:hypothetical protein